MKHILARTQRSLLEQFAWSRALLAFDFDGTLAPIVREPTAAVMRASTRTRLVELAHAYPCAVISGRSRADVASRLSGVPLVEVVGNHGLEPSPDVERLSHLAASWAHQLEAALDSLQGVEIERKGPSIAVHYRKSRSRNDAKSRIDEAIVGLKGKLRVILGKLVVNLVPEGAPHKGVALRRIRETIKADTAIYVGDDVTDEDVFALDEPGRLLSIRIGRDDGSAARYYLRAQGEIDKLMDSLLTHRKRAQVATGGIERA